jgi:hypothetical protein
MNPSSAGAQPSTADRAGDAARTGVRPQPDPEAPAAGRRDQAASPDASEPTNQPNVSEALADRIRRSRASYPLGGGLCMHELIQEGRR